MGILATLNQSLSGDIAKKVADKFNIKLEVKQDKESREEKLRKAKEQEKAAQKQGKTAGKLLSRPPVVTVMGHVDHGKTTLLDAYRHTHVTDSEFGGITQHIGAYQVELEDKSTGERRKITFLDTPGHAAFTQMRARGASVTDIAILVVAADDAVMPQTIEAIEHAKAAKVPIIVAINKIDKEGANPEKCKQQLSEHGLMCEEWGGDTICVEISAKKKINLDELLEMVLLVADMAELKAEVSAGKVQGAVIEAHMEQGRGVVATVLIQKGTLKIGTSVVAGETHGKVRAMFDYKGENIQKATCIHIRPNLFEVLDIPLKSYEECEKFLQDFENGESYSVSIIEEQQIATLFELQETLKLMDQQKKIIEDKINAFKQALLVNMQERNLLKVELENNDKKLTITRVMPKDKETIDYEKLIADNPQIKIDNYKKYTPVKEYVKISG